MSLKKKSYDDRDRDEHLTDNNINNFSKNPINLLKDCELDVQLSSVNHHHPSETDHLDVPPNNDKFLTNNDRNDTNFSKFNMNLSKNKNNLQPNDEDKFEEGNSDRLVRPSKRTKLFAAVPIKMKLMPQSIMKPIKRVAPKVELSDVFNEDDAPSDEEMPPEAKMRMRNMGKDTPTSSGPNSFNKGKLGFCNYSKLFEKHLKTGEEDDDEKL